MEIITMARPKKNKVKLTDDEIKHLKSILKKKDTNQILSARCRILINLDEDHQSLAMYLYWNLRYTMEMMRRHCQIL